MNKLTYAAAAFVVMMSACSDSVDPRVIAATEDAGIVSPLNFIIGVDGDAPSAVATERAAQDVLVDCMAEAGFSYLPVPIPEQPGPTSSATRPARAEIAESGYGFADQLEFELSDAAQGPFVDPNDELRAALSTQELAAYDTALSGLDASEVSWAPNGEPIDPETGLSMSPEAFEEASSDGCLFRAYSDQINPNAANLLASEAYFELQQRLMGDPRMVALLADWAQCMAAEGYDYRTPEASRADLAQRADDARIGLMEADSAADSTRVQDTIDELRNAEALIAVTDLDCSEALFDETPDINRELEIEFILENEDRIVAILEESS